MSLEICGNLAVEGSGGGSLMDDWSLEITAKDIIHVDEVAPLLPRGMQISITFLPNEDFESRVAAAAHVRKLGFVPMPHVSARRLHSAADLERFLDRLAQEAAVDRVFVVGGDLETPSGPYADALAVINSGLLADFGVRHVGIAGYPEGHPRIATSTLWEALDDKVRALEMAGHSCSIMTQFGFDPEPVIAWLAELRRRSIHAPVRMGIAGPTSVKTLLKFAARCGVASSAKILSKYGVSLTRLLGSAGPDPLIDAVVRQLNPRVHGRLGLHVYPFGGLVSAAKWAAEADGRG